MKILSRDIPENPPIPALDIIQYLQSGGWRKVEVYTDRGLDRASVWEDSKGESEIYLPLQSQAREYRRLLAEAINAIAQVEARPAQEILADLRVKRADVVRVRRTGPSVESGLPLSEGSTLFAATESLLVAAAKAAISPKRAYYGPRPNRVQDFSRDAVFGQTEEGSFVVRVIVPLPPRLPARQASFPISTHRIRPTKISPSTAR